MFVLSTEMLLHLETFFVKYAKWVAEMICYLPLPSEKAMFFLDNGLNNS